MTDFKENLPLAKRIAAGVVALSIVVIGPFKLGKLHTQALNVFKNGTQTAYTVSIYNDIRSAAEAANVLAGLAGDNTLKQLAQDITALDDPAALLETFYALKSRADDVYTAYERTSPADLSEAKKALAQINSAYTTIGNDSYWQYADKFNSARSGFPAAILAWLAGADELPDK